MIIDLTALAECHTHLIGCARDGREEGVGLLSGPLDGPTSAGPGLLTNVTVTRWTPLLNVSDFPRVRYEVDNGELIAAYDALEAEGLRPYILVHSHLRTGAAPSPTDIRYATNPTLLYMIVDLEGPRPVDALWRITPGGNPECVKIRFQVADLRERKNLATDLTRGVASA